MPRPKKINWEEAKAFYMADRLISVKQIAKKYKLSYSHVGTIASREGWRKEREERWKNAETEALKEVDGSIKDFIVRHAKVARFLQHGGIKRLQKRLLDLDKLDENPKLRKEIKNMDDRTLIALVSEGLKAERELYPKQMQVLGQVSVEVSGISDALDKAIYESFRKSIGRKRPSIHKRSTKKKSGK